MTYFWQTGQMTWSSPRCPTAALTSASSKRRACSYSRKICCSEIKSHVYMVSQFPPKDSQETPHSSPMRASYGVSVENFKSDLYSASVSAVLCVISWYVGPRHNGTWLYLHVLTWLILRQSHYCPTASDASHTTLKDMDILPANWGYGHGHTRGSLIYKPLHGTT